MAVAKRHGTHTIEWNVDRSGRSNSTGSSIESSLVGKSEVVGPKTLEPYLTVISERALLNREIKTRGPTK